MFWSVISIVSGFLVTKNTKNFRLLFYKPTRHKIPLDQPALLLCILVIIFLLTLISLWLIYEKHITYNDITRTILGLAIGILACRWLKYGIPTVLQSAVLLILALASFEIGHSRNFIHELGFAQIETPRFSTSVLIHRKDALEPINLFHKYYTSRPLGAINQAEIFENSNDRPGLIVRTGQIVADAGLNPSVSRQSVSRQSVSGANRFFQLAPQTPRSSRKKSFPLAGHIQGDDSGHLQNHRTIQHYI